MNKENNNPEVKGGRISDLETAETKKITRRELAKIESGESHIFPFSKLLEQILRLIKLKKEKD